MGKNKRPNVPLQNACINKILHAFDRRQRWKNVRKELPNKRHGSGKHIIDGGCSEPTTNTIEPPEVHRDPKKNKPTKNEQETTETRSKKFRIRSLISDEMAKRRGRRHSSSPTRSPKKKTNSLKKSENDQQGSKCESPSAAKKKRKCDICAAMLSVSYLRQKGLENENMVIEDKKQQPAETLEDHYKKIGLPTSFSFPLLAPNKTRSDFELQQLKHKLRDFKDIQTTKEKFILPMNQWHDVGFLKPMLTRPESFTDSASRKEKKRSKTLKQKIGFVVKVDTKKEKRRILMDAVFHKIPYGRKDPKKVLKTISATTTAPSLSSSAEKKILKKTSSTSEAMSKYRKLLSQTSTRDEKLQHSSTDHKTKLFVAGDHSFEKRIVKRIRSLPNISPYDFMHNQEFPVMDIHLSISSTMFDDQRPSDHFEIYSETRNVPENIVETKSTKKNEVVDEHLELGTSTLEKINYQNESEAASIESGAELETSSNEQHEAIQENLRVSHDQYQEQNDHQKQVVDEDLNGSNHEENQKEPRVAIEVENDKSFNEILGMFQKVSDERIKLNIENESCGVVQKVGKNSQRFFKKQVGQSNLDHQEKDKSPLTSDSELNRNLEVSQNTMDHQEKDKSGSKHIRELEHKEQDQRVDEIPQVCQHKLDHHQEENETSCSESAPASHFLMDIPNSQLEDENKQYMFSINDVDEKRPKDMQATYDGFLHSFQFVKELLEKSGYLKKEVLRFGEYWYSSYQPMDPLLFEEVETNFLQTKLVQELDSMKDEEVVQKIYNDHHLLLFDLINEALMEIYNKTYAHCPHPLTYPSKVVPMPVGGRLLEQVWDIVNKYLRWKPELDDAVSRDLAKGNGWMNLQADAEFVGIQLEELLVDDLLDELVFDDLLI